jgi:hypothetical protein
MGADGQSGDASSKHQRATGMNHFVGADVFLDAPTSALSVAADRQRAKVETEPEAPQLTDRKDTDNFCRVSRLLS